MRRLSVDFRFIFRFIDTFLPVCHILKPLRNLAFFFWNVKFLFFCFVYWAVFLFMICRSFVSLFMLLLKTYFHSHLFHFSYMFCFWFVGKFAWYNIFFIALVMSNGQNWQRDKVNNLGKQDMCLFSLDLLLFLQS